MNAKLSTHVLDTHSGCPAANVPWKLEFLSADQQWIELGTGVTNADGRTDAPLLLDEKLKTGKYRLSFSVAEYYRNLQTELAEPPFLDEVPIIVNLSAGQSYHVPLLVTPWSYSTYRGS